jgi:hypothetical protein
MTFWQRACILRWGGVGLTPNPQALGQVYCCYLLVSYLNTLLLARAMQSVVVEWRTDST